MLESETIDDFNAKLCDISNEAFALGEKYSETKLVRKMNLKHNKKEKSIALQAEVQNSIDEDDIDDKEDLTETVTSLTKNFNKIMNRKKNFSKSNNFQKGKAAVNLFESNKKSKGIQCHECEGFGHIRSECANTLKKKGKSLNSTWSDEESEWSQKDDEDRVTNYVAFNIVTDYAITVMKTVATPVRAWKEMYNKWIQVRKISKTLEIRVEELCKENDVLKKAMINYEFLAAKKEMKLQETILELENN
ncbi:hypothetical protein TIFTF001_032785 [Ficus carica]|uniref:CCHC-type domain-containing protein n=1 Tax=Ficus carica TaxID=3494 RepID=A0AA88DXU8_FICCA|nr:hypothetical protein TIFTF001_032785 [Ficus carica]